MLVHENAAANNALLNTFAPSALNRVCGITDDIVVAMHTALTDLLLDNGNHSSCRFAGASTNRNRLSVTLYVGAYHTVRADYVFADDGRCIEKEVR